MYTPLCYLGLRMPSSYEPPTLLDGFSFFCLYRHDIAIAYVSQSPFRTFVCYWSSYRTSCSHHLILLHNTTVKVLCQQLFCIFIHLYDMPICPLFSYWVWERSLSSARTYYTSGSRICTSHPYPFRSYPHLDNTYMALREI